ncbi:hypothetical protein KI387_008774 [Taxus chinensis]|uniref:Uncharacterized protein n=1 Tax=Taxus chinensis TaxID=29808 RepID=A0AA38CQ37_TAXCH|nr:hypothetical protein KI387_008774 [Taxus chinensis]
MRIISDKKDYNFVEKVQLLEDEILGLSNKLVPASTLAYSVNPPRTRINFNALSKLCFPTVGFYGDKKTMIKIFCMEFLLDESVLAQLEEGTGFEPGFYISVPQEAGGLLFAFYWHEEHRAFTKTISIKKISMKTCELNSVLEQCSLVSNVDYSNLSNKHFINLLSCCRPREYTTYHEWKISFKNRDFESCIHSTEGFLRSSLKVLPDFYSYVVLFLSGEIFETKYLSKISESTNALHYNTDIDRLEQLHRELSMVLTWEGSDGDHKVLLFGSDIKLVCRDAKHVITVESLCKDEQPYMCIAYEKNVRVKCSSLCSYSKHIDAEEMFIRVSNVSKCFPLSSEKVQIILFNPTPGKVRSSPKKSKVEGTVKIATNSSLSIILNWLEWMVPYELKSLESNIVFTAFFLRCDEHMALKFMKQNLKTYNLHSLPNVFQSLYQKYQNCSPSQSTVDRAALLSHDTLKTLCCEAYQSQVQIFFQNIRKELSVNMQKKEVDFNKEKEQKLYEQAEDKFVQQFKEKLSRYSKDNLVTKYIAEEVIKCSIVLWTIFYGEQEDQVELKISVKECHLDVVWKACEMNAMKKEYLAVGK